MKNMDKSNIKLKISPEDAMPVVLYSNYITVPIDKNWPAHNINDLELVFILNGVFSAKDKDHPKTILSPGDILLIRPGIPCDLLQEKYGNPSLISCIHFELLPDKKWINGSYDIAPSEPWVINSRGDVFLIELFRRCTAEFNSFSRYRSDMLSLIFKQIWLTIMRIHIFGMEQSNSRISAMLEFIRRNINKNIGRAEIAAEFKLTPQYVNYIFKREFGLSPGRVIMREKIHAAAEMLSKGKHNVSEVAWHFGFSDPLYFSRIFRKITGSPPSKFK